MKTTTRTRKPTRSPIRNSSRPQLPPPLWLRLLRKPIHALLIALLLWPPQAWAALAPAGGGNGSQERADLAPPAEPLGAASGGAQAGTSARDGAEGAASASTTAALSAKEAASGLDPDLEAMIEEEEQAERREAQASSSASDGGSGGGSGTNPLGAALGATPQVDHFTGGARLEIPIQIPPGRRDATPELKLVYSSAAGDSPWGFGWDLPIGHISRSTKWGVPTCPLNVTDDKVDFVLNLNGSSLELKHQYSFQEHGATTHFYRARITESYLEIWANTGTRNRWDVWDRAGNKYEFGRAPAARIHSGVDTFYDTRYNATTGANCDFTTQWMLTKFISPNGNEIVYTYSKDVGNNATYLRYIDYGGNGRNPKLREAPFRIVFDGTIALVNRDRGTPLNDPKIHPWAPAPRSISYARGVLQRRYWVIANIGVFYRPRPGSVHHLIRQYKLDYWDDPYTGRSFLQRVRTLDHAGRELAPPQTFEYASSQLDFAPEAVVPGPMTTSAPETHHLSHTVPHSTRGYTGAGPSRFGGTLDANGDGYVDLLGASDNRGWVIPGNAAGSSRTRFDWKGVGTPTTHLAQDYQRSKSRHGQSRFADFTGDGIPDRLTAITRINKWYLYRGACAKPTDCRTGPYGYTMTAPPDTWLEYHPNRKQTRQAASFATGLEWRRTARLCPRGRDAPLAGPSEHWQVL